MRLNLEQSARVRVWALVMALALLALACGASDLNPPPATNTPIPPTPTLLPIIVPTATPAAVGNGTVTGALGYPSEVIPPMKVYFENVNTADVLTLSTGENQGTYSKTLPPGTYHVYAWLEGNGLGGSYSAAVPCGLTVDCTDHSLLPVVVTAGGTTAGIDITDWYGPAGSVPLPAGASAPTTGRIEGVLHYPSEGIPALAVYARNTATNETLVVDTAENQQSFSFEEVPPGTYVLFAWLPDGSLGGAYTQAVPCGLSVDCTDHALIEVPVAAGQVSSGVDIGDWYEPSVVPAP
jgi:hypothetical protein